MAVQAVIDEQLGAVLQCRLIAHRTRPLVDVDVAAAGKCHDRREEQCDQKFFHFLHPHFIVTRSGTGRNLSIRDHHGISRKKPK